MIKKNLLLCFFILLKFVLQYRLVSPVYELHRDEFLHLDQGRHLAWGYLSVPPLTAGIAYIINWLGNGEFWIRFFTALFGALTMLLVWKAIETLKGGFFALILGAVAILFSILLRINILFQPNSLDILCWVSLYFCLLKYITSQQSKWLWFAAIAVAIGFLNKYNIVFAVVGLLPALLLTEQRNIFLNKNLYRALIATLLIISPNIWWQYQHNFPVIHHMQELSATQLINVSRVSFLKEQGLFFIGGLFILLAAFISFYSYTPFKKYIVLLYAFLFTLALYVLLRAKGYYAIGLYPIFFSFGAVYIEYLLKNGWKKWLRPVALAIPILLFIPFLRIAFPLKSPAAIKAHPQIYKRFGMLRWEDGIDHTLPQDFADMQGWKELAGIADSVYNKIADKEHTLIRCDNYGQAGAINYYSKNKNIGALSYNADYVNWFPKNKKWVNLILIKEINDADKERKDENPLFDSIYLAGKIQNEYAREYGTAVYVLMGAKAGVNEIIEREIKKKQQRN